MPVMLTAWPLNTAHANGWLNGTLELTGYLTALGSVEGMSTAVTPLREPPPDDV